MKNLKFGSFPLANIDVADRKCIDSYMIMNFAKLILMNKITSSNNNKVKKYRTPNAVLSAITNTGSSISLNNSSDITNTESEMNDTIRTFNAFKEIYHQIGQDPFYKDSVIYPIYMEQKIENQTAIQYDYDFLLLTNDLQKNQSLDELKYDDKTTLSFLLLKDLLYPDVALQNLESIRGTNSKVNVNEFRMNFAKFIEHSKNVKKNPIEVFESIIKSVGRTFEDERIKKEKGKKTNFQFNRDNLLTTMRNTLGNNTDNKNTKKLFSEMFTNLGQVRSASDLENLNFKDIFNFTNEPLESTENYNDNIIKREFNFQKTQEITNILQILDSLIIFNNTSIKDMYSDVKSRTNNIKIKSEDNKDFDIDLDELIGQINNSYFNKFVSKINSRITNQFKFLNQISIEKEHKKFKTEETNNYAGIINSIETINKERDTVLDNLSILNADFDNLSDPNNLIGNYSNQLTKYSNIYTTNFNGLMLNGQYNYIDFDMDNSNLREKLTSKKNKKITYDYYNDYIKNLLANITNLRNENQLRLDRLNNDIIGHQQQLKANNFNGNVEREFKESVSFEIKDLIDSFTFIHKDIIKFVQHQNNLSDLINKHKKLLDNPTTFINSTYEKDFKDNELYKAAQLALEDLIKETKDQIKENLFATEMDTPESKKALSTFYNMMDTFIKEVFNEQITKPIIRHFSKSNDEIFKQSEDLRMDNNPIFKSLLTTKGSNSLKTFILTEDILVDFYDSTYYFDQLKYRNGIIKNIVQKLNNKDNKINRSLIRLGLEDCAVFIIGKGNNIYLKMPNLLSLTSSSFFTKIATADLKQSCMIKKLSQQWDGKAMFDYKIRMRNKLAKKTFGGNSNNIGNTAETVRNYIKTLEDDNYKLKDSDVLQTQIKHLNDKLSKHNIKKLSKDEIDKLKTKKIEYEEEKIKVDKNNKAIKKYQQQIENYEKRLEMEKENQVTDMDNFKNMTIKDNSNSNYSNSNYNAYSNKTSDGNRSTENQRSTGSTENTPKVIRPNYFDPNNK